MRSIYFKSMKRRTKITRTLAICKELFLEQRREASYPACTGAEERGWRRGDVEPMHSPKPGGNCFGSNAERRAWEQIGNEKS
jgi:hypothetical protein